MSGRWCAGASDFSNVPHPDHVKVVDTMNYAAAFPLCRAVVHHGGAGTTAAGLRAGVPTLILSTDLDQTPWKPDQAVESEDRPATFGHDT